MVKKSLVSAPGKIILSGEHSVVYGQPAVLGAINRRLFIEIEKSEDKLEIISDEDSALAYYALQKIEEFLGKKINNLKIKIKSEIPINRGMGSSAALSVAMIGGVFRWFNREWDKNLIYKIAHKIERKQHQNSSGCDISISLFGGLIIFQKGKIKKLDFTDLPNFILLDSGQAVESTGEMVSRVSAKSQNFLNKMGDITLRLIEVLKKGKPDGFKNLILENERLLEKLGVVGEKAKKIIREIEDLGGAAKICGAGGIKKGSGILLCYHQEPEILLSFAKKNQIPSYQLKLEKEGLRNEN
ncbi:mevalonate kinase [Candidatus Microgenomates bacterium]|nr:mevalonate kinase [Candidatus Microgenomates bacterium]